MEVLTPDNIGKIVVAIVGGFVWAVNELKKRKQLKGAEESIEALKLKIESQARQIVDLTNALKLQSYHYDQLKINTDEAQQERDNLQFKVARLEQSERNLLTQVNSSNARISQLEKQLTEAIAANDALARRQSTHQQQTQHNKRPPPSGAIESGD